MKHSLKEFTFAKELTFVRAAPGEIKSRFLLKRLFVTSEGLEPSTQ